MVYNYTKPRGPIAAMYKSPGPCYFLPGLIGQRVHDPRSVHRKGPAYPFGIRRGKFRDECSPGPAYYPSAKLYRDGKDGTPHYSLYGRHRELTSSRTPGPGAYRPESAGPSTKYSNPAYSFGTRHRLRRNDGTPGPNNYTIPTVMGSTVQSNKKQAPCYSLSGRQSVGGFSADLSKTPGPGAYNVTNAGAYQNQPPSYSMTSRNTMPGDSSQKPGPGAHSPKVDSSRPTTPYYSFGIKHSPYVCPLIADND